VLLLMMLLLMVVVVVDYSRSRVVCRMVVWRRQALRWVGVMLEKNDCQQEGRMQWQKQDAVCATMCGRSGQGIKKNEAGWMECGAADRDSRVQISGEALQQDMRGQGKDLTVGYTGSL